MARILGQGEAAAGGNARNAPLGYMFYLTLVGVLLFIGAVAWLVIEYQLFRAEVRVACGRTASLDLDAWAAVCRKVVVR